MGNVRPRQDRVGGEIDQRGAVLGVMLLLPTVLQMIAFIAVSGVLLALVFLYILSAIFLFGGELNGTVIAAKRRRLHKLHDQRFEEVRKAPL